MFTINQIKEAHAKVTSGADFPQYVQDLAGLGVTAYATYVGDGHAEYNGKDDYHIQSDGKYAALDVAETGNPEQFKHNLKIHQQGQTDYSTFCRHAADAGVEKWIVNITSMTCTYYDGEGNKMLVEDIPYPS